MDVQESKRLNSMAIIRVPKRYFAILSFSLSMAKFGLAVLYLMQQIFSCRALDKLKEALKK